MSGRKAATALDPQRIANTAHSFLFAANRAAEPRPLPSGASEILMVPHAACLAFSAELYLKALITLEGGRASGHGLVDLFDSLSTASRDVIRAQLSMTKTAMKASLGDASDAFVTWRYIYESEARSLDLGFLRRLIEAVSSMAEALLKARRDKPPGPPP